MDKEYTVLSLIESSKDITQRELSRKLGVSLGSINLLINKMVDDGLIKFKQLPFKRIAYMVTPKGMSEKAKKTLCYIKENYSYIQQIKVKIKTVIYGEQQLCKDICVIAEDDEIGQLMRTIACELDNIGLARPGKYSRDRTYIVTDVELYEKLKSEDYQVINILDKI